MTHLNNTKSKKSNWRNKFSSTTTTKEATTSANDNDYRLAILITQKIFQPTPKPIRSKASNFLKLASPAPVAEQKPPPTTTSTTPTSNHVTADFDDVKPSVTSIASRNKSSYGNFSFSRLDEGSLFGGGPIGRPEILAMTLGGLLLFWLLLAIVVLYAARLKRVKNKNCFAKISASEASKSRMKDVMGDDCHRKVLDLTSASPNDEACLILSPSSCTFNLCSPVTGIHPGLSNSWVADDFKSPSTCSMSYPFLLGYQRSASEEPAAGRRAEESKNIYDHGNYVEINNIKMDNFAPHGKTKPDETGEEYLTIDRLIKRSTFDGSSTDGTTRTNISSIVADQTLKKQIKDQGNKRESAFSEYFLQSGAMNLSLRTLEVDANYNHGSHTFLKQAIANNGPRKIPTMGSSISLQRKGVPSLVSPTSAQLSSSLSQFADTIEKNKVTTPCFETNFETLPGGTIFTTQALMTRMSKERRQDDCPPLPPRKVRREISPPLLSPGLISPADKHYRPNQMNQNQGQTGSQKTSHYGESRCRASGHFDYKQRMKNLDHYYLTPQLSQKAADDSLPDQQALQADRKLSKKILSQSFDKPRQPIMGQTRLAERNKNEQGATVAAMNQQQQQQQFMHQIDGSSCSMQRQEHQQQLQQQNGAQECKSGARHNQLRRVKRPDKMFSTSTPTLPKRQSHRECRTEILQRRWFKHPSGNDSNSRQRHADRKNSVSEDDANGDNSEESVWKYNRLNNINSPEDESRNARARDQHQFHHHHHQQHNSVL